MDAHFNVSVIQTATDLVTAWCNERNIPEDHGLGHFLIVADHAKCAIREANRTVAEGTNTVLAALLHDMDDRKLTGVPTGEYANARGILAQLNLPAGAAEQVIKEISIVAASANGNSRPDIPDEGLARECDRLEAIGVAGVERCRAYTLRVGRPIYTPATPMPCSLEELDAVMATYSIESYMARGGSSASMLDHFYDKLLHFDVVHSGNAYIMAKTEERMNYMRNWLVETNRAIMN
jgi:HD superfamily phosphodiesterase